MKRVRHDAVCIATPYALFSAVTANVEQIQVFADASEARVRLLSSPERFKGNSNGDLYIKKSSSLTCAGGKFTRQALKDSFTTNFIKPSTERGTFNEI